MTTLQSNDFELFGLPQRFEQERSALDARWKALQAEVHPDRFAAEGGAAQRVAMQWAVRVNEAYQRLKDPRKRAAYLCELHGAPIRAESNTAMPPQFLVQQMHWRETLEDAEGEAALDLLSDEVMQARNGMLAELHRLIDEKRDFAAAADRVRALMFVERFADELDRKLEAPGQ